MGISFLYSWSCFCWQPPHELLASDSEESFTFILRGWNVRPISASRSILEVLSRYSGEPRILFPRNDDRTIVPRWYSEKNDPSVRRIRKQGGHKGGRISSAFRAYSLIKRYAQRDYRELPSWLVRLKVSRATNSESYERGEERAWQDR